MKNFWGGFMKKRISCKVIKSIPLVKEDVVSSFGDVLNLHNLSSYFIFVHEKSKPVTYTKNMEIEIEPLIDNQMKPSIDFLA